MGPLGTWLYPFLEVRCGCASMGASRPISTSCISFSWAGSSTRRVGAVSHDGMAGRESSLIFRPEDVSNVAVVGPPW